MLAVIIPTLNAQDVLPRLLPDLSGGRVIVSDGGSDDGTLSLAAKAGAQIAYGTAGRGAQAARGAELAGADDTVRAYLFLHADCRVPAGWRAAVDAALQTPNTVWFFRYRPDATGMGAMWLRFIVWLRCWGWRLPYGDQGLLIPRDMYEALGGFDRAKPLFEDVDMIDRIKAKYGRATLRPLPVALTTDVSDHLREGILTRGWRNYRLLKAYRRGAPIADLLKRYG